MRERPATVAVRLAALSFCVVGGALAIDAMMSHHAAASDKPAPGIARQAVAETTALRDVPAPGQAKRSTHGTHATRPIAKPPRRNHAGEVIAANRALQPPVGRPERTKADRPARPKGHPARPGPPIDRALPTPVAGEAASTTVDLRPDPLVQSVSQPISAVLPTRREQQRSLTTPVLDLANPESGPVLIQLTTPPLEALVAPRTILSELPSLRPRAGPSDKPDSDQAMDEVPAPPTTDGYLLASAQVLEGKRGTHLRDQTSRPADRHPTSPRSQQSDGDNLPASAPSRGGSKSSGGGPACGDARSAATPLHRLAQLDVVRHGDRNAAGRQPGPGTRPA